MAQSWSDLLFAHWPVDPAEVAAKLPAGLEPDLFDGRAWLGVVPFRMSGVRWRGMPAVPGLSAFPELNLRTYVTRGGRPGVYFFSLDAHHAVAGAIARRFFHLPYFRARMAMARGPLDVRNGSGDGWISYQSERIHAGAPSARVHLRYRPAPGAVAVEAAPGSLDRFLTARYRLFTADRRGQILAGEINHGPWPLSPAEAEIDADDLFRAAGFEPPSGPPRLAFSTRVDVRLWWPRPDDGQARDSLPGTG